MLVSHFQPTPDDGLIDTGKDYVLTLTSDPGGARSDTLEITMPACEFVSLFDHRQICARVQAHLAGDPEAQFVFSDCDAYSARSGRCARGDTHAGRHLCAFLIARDDPSDQVWRDAACWTTADLPVYDDHGQPTGRTAPALLWNPQPEPIAAPEPCTTEA